MKEKLFVYGTLMYPKVQKRIIGRVIKSSKDILKNFEKTSVEIKGGIYPALVPKEGSSIKGLVLELNSFELKKTDEYETNKYKRIKVNLQKQRSAWVYVKNKK